MPDAMTKEDWAQLEALCRKALEDAPNSAAVEHDLYQAVALTAAFAASVQKHWGGDATP